MTLTQTVEIPENRLLRLDLEIPREVPTGAMARFELVWSPEIEKVNSNKADLNASLERIWALCKDAPISVDSFLEERRRDNEIEERRYREHFGEDN